MDKKTAQNLIETTFNDVFNEEQFIRFSQELLNDIDFSHGRNWSTLIYEDFKDRIAKYKRVGLYTDPEGNEIEVLIIEVEKFQMLERARTSLRNFVIKWLQSDKNKSKSRDYALVAFYAKDDNGNDWRFSFVKVEQTSFMDEDKGKVKLKKEFTPAKRYSFLVGKYEKAHTAKNQLLPLLQNISNNPTIEELENAFSIEKVTDEFFNQYKDLYVKLYEHFENDGKVKVATKESGIDNARFTKKLLGQIVFLYFLQKKGWLGVAKNERWGTGKKRFVQELYEQAQKEKVNFFKDKLQYLFYEALAKERDNVNSYYKRFDCRIPFLNGGLFEADYNWQEANITIPESLFRNDEKNKAGDVGTGILDVFDRYNFTIKEDEPLDKEVAVDPEMLGKVFENMLDITERKSKGAFYTPREIVHYMCQESLIHYLDNSLDGKVDKKDIEDFIRKGHSYLENDINALKKIEKIKAGEQKSTDAELKTPESVRKNAELIDQKLSSIKICDPAIGSGAFPVGILHELVNAMLVLKPHLSYDYLTEKLKDFGFEHRESISDSRYIYRLKRHIIQESIYGVDIDASAIDIARLRLWLSLVVDEDDLDPIETLPNLDYKIVSGNSLISRYPLDIPINEVFIELNKKIQDKNYNNKTIKDLVGNNEINLEFYKKVTNDFLIESSHEKKQIFREFIHEIKSAFKTTLQNKELTKLSKARGEIQNLQVVDVFGEQVGTKKQIDDAKKKLKKLEKERDEALEGKIYKNALEWRFEFPNLLDEKGDFVGFDVVIGNPPYGEIIKDNKEHFKRNFESTEGKFEIYKYFIEKGTKITNPIGSVTFITPDTWINLGYFKKLREILFKKHFIYLITETLYNVFSSATVDNNIFLISNSKRYSKTSLISGDLKKVQTINLNYIEKDYSIILKPTNEIISKINQQPKILDDLCEVWQGLIAYGSKEQERIWSSDTKETDFHKKLLYGGEIDMFKIEWKGEYLKYGEWLHRPRPTYIYEKPHILVQRIRNPKLKQRIKGAIDRDFHVNGTGTSNIILKENCKLKLEEILCYLNSEVINYWFSYYFFDVNIKPEQLRQIPLPVKSEESLFILEQFLEFTKSKYQLLFDFFWSLCNGIVYEIYFPEEIKSAGKEILKHLGDLKPITDDMSEEKKLAIIQSEFERLYDPNHPVRFAIETLDSVEEVRIIKEALK